MFTIPYIIKTLQCSQAIPVIYESLFDVLKTDVKELHHRILVKTWQAMDTFC